MKVDSPENVLRNGGIEGLGKLGDNRAVPLLLEWSSPGKPLQTRQAAMTAIAGLDKQNKEITKALVSYLHEPYFDVNFWVLFAIGERGDPDAIGPLEDLLKSGSAGSEEKHMIERQIESLKGRAGANASPH